MVIMLICAGVAIVGAGIGSAGQRRTAPRTPSRTAPKTYSYVLTLAGKKYSVTSTQALPLSALQQTFKDAGEAPTLRTLWRLTSVQLASVEAELKAAKDELEEAKNKLEESEEKLEEAQDKLEEAQNDLEEAHTAARDVQRQVMLFDLELSGLKRNIGYFSYMDWKSVVPDVERKMKWVDTYFDDLKSAIDDLKTD